MKKIFLILVCISIQIQNSNYSWAQNAVLKADNYMHYIDSFNVHDNEIYKEYITNDRCRSFLSENIPLFDCPDQNMEQIYYFRWWTYRKHIKQTPEGFVITEFLPDVPWAGKYNTISCAAAFHFYEGRWLHDARCLNDYARFWFHGGGSISTYSFWSADALYNQYLVTNNRKIIEELFPDLIINYENWEKEKHDSTGLFWQIDGMDGMEMAVCGSGYRATINSYMYGDAIAISKIASLLGQKDISEKFTQKALLIKQLMQDKLWDSNDQFFKVLPRGMADARLCNTRELHGYTPWYFNIPDKEYSQAWKYLMDPKHFYAPYGLTSAEQCSSGFQISYEGHECQWNGPSWPYATSITLTAMANLLNDYSQDYISKNDYFKLLKDYSRSQQLKMENGRTVPWIDENLNPFTGDWISRTRLKAWKNGTWSDDKGGIERGKDYNHSTFCDLIITGLIGIRPQPDNSLVINPLLPDNTWKYFCIDNILYHGKIITVLYDETGKRYNRGRGMQVLSDGKVIATSSHIGTIKVAGI